MGNIVIITMYDLFRLYSVEDLSSVGMLRLKRKWNRTFCLRNVIEGL